MTSYYVLGSEAHDALVPIGKVHLMRRDAETAARNLNLASARLQVQVLEVNGESLESQPALIREHVRQFLRAQSDARARGRTRGVIA